MDSKERKFKPIHAVMILGLIALGWLAWDKIFPEPKPHKPIKTVVLWVPNNGIELKTTVSLRYDYDTTYPFKKWTPRYFVPIETTSVVKQNGKDTTVQVIQWGYVVNNKVVVFDYNQNY